MPTPVVYFTAIATTAPGLASPMTIAPKPVKPLPPDEVFTASGYRKLNGLWGRELYWEITNPADMSDIFTRSGGTSASCIAGFVRCKDHVPRDATYETWSDWSCFIDQPIKGDWQFGGVRSNLMVRVRRMVLYATLPTTA